MEMNVQMAKPAKLPPALERGDRVAIVSPASKIAPELIDSAVAMLEKEGYEPVVMPHAKGESGSFSATAHDTIFSVEPDMWMVAQSGMTNPATSRLTPVFMVCSRVTGMVAADDCVPRAVA